MGRRSGKFPFFPDVTENLKILKFISVIAPALLVLALEVLRHSLFKDPQPNVVGDLIVFLMVAVSGYFFSNFVFNRIAKKHQENLRRNWELAILNDIAQTVNETLNLDVLLRRSMEKLVQVTRADAGELFLINEKNQEPRFVLRIGGSEDVSGSGFGLLSNDGMVSQAALSNEPVIIQDIKNTRRTIASLLLDTQFRSLVVIPLRSRSGVMGVFGLLSYKQGHFRLDEIGLLKNIGNQIATAMENARLYEKVQAMAVIEERERISKELHDGLAQVLGYVITKSQATRQILRKMTVANDYLVELENIAQNVYTDTRDDIMGLRTVISGDRDMVSVVREYLNRYSQMHGIKISLEVGDQIIPSLSPKVELQAIRIMQEALSNIRKHASATHVSVRLATSNNEVTFVIEDDGKGFDVDRISQGDSSKFGISTIKERAESINSKLEIASQPEHGTRVTLCIPLSIPTPAGEQDKVIESINS